MGPLVSVDWLHDRLGEVMVLDATLPPVGVTPPADTLATYLEAHVPGAVFFDIEALSDQVTTLPHMLPTASAFGDAMAALGVSSAATVVVYEQVGLFSAPRARWMLRAFGVRDVVLLDGGLTAWTDAGLPTEAGRPVRERAVFDAVLDESAVAHLDDLGGQVLDARSAARFAGSAPEPRPGLPSGHMPGSVNLPFTELAADGRLRPAAELVALLEGKGVDLTQPLTTTCGSGVTAAVVALALEVVGAQQVRLYDGSWAEYAQAPGAVIEAS